MASSAYYVKKRPGEINVAVLSRGGIPHLTSEWIKLAAGLDWTSINYPGTPAPIATKISDDLRAVLNDPATKKRFEDIASYVNPMSGAELLAYIRTEQALWKPVIEQISTFKPAPK